MNMTLASTLPTKPERYLFRAATGLTLLIPVSIFAGIAVIDINLSLIGFLFLLRSVTAKDAKCFKETWFMAAVAFWVYLNINSLFARYPLEGLEAALPWIRFPVFALALQKWTFRDPRVRKWFVTSTICALCFVTLDGFWQLFHGADIFGRPLFLFRDIVRVTGPLKKFTLGFNATFIMFPAILIATEFIFTPSADRRLKGLSVLFIIGVIALVVIAGDRMPLMLTFLGLTLAVLLYQRLRKFVIWIVLLILAVSVLALIISPRIMQRQLVSTLDTISDFDHSEYSKTFSTGMLVFKTAPIFGVGARNYQHILEEDICKGVVPSFDPKDERLRYLCSVLWIHPHNLYIELLAESGIVGLIGFLIVMGIWVKDIRRMHRESPGLLQNPVFLGALITVVLRLWPIASSASFYEAWSVAHLWCMIGLMYGIRESGYKRAAGT